MVISTGGCANVTLVFSITNRKDGTCHQIMLIDDDTEFYSKLMFSLRLFTSGIVTLIALMFFHF